MGDTEHNSGWGFWDVIALVCIILFIAAVAIPRHHDQYPNTSPANTCINNMRQIDGAINEWALVNGKNRGTGVTENDITNYIKLDRYGKIPPCPSGGKYTYGKVGDVPQISCSLSTANPPHVLLSAPAQ
jgi:hypothetical protein